MNKTINLRQARKQRDRALRRARGDQNALRFGEATPLVRLRQAESAREDRVHSAHRLSDDGDDGGSDD